MQIIMAHMHILKGGTMIYGTIILIVKIQGYIPADENIISFTSESGQLGPVPVPSTLLLFGSGLFGLIGMRRRFKKVQV